MPISLRAFYAINFNSWHAPSICCTLIDELGEARRRATDQLRHSCVGHWEVFPENKRAQRINVTAQVPLERLARHGSSRRSRCEHPGLVLVK